MNQVVHDLLLDLLVLFLLVVPILHVHLLGPVVQVVHGLLLDLLVPLVPLVHVFLLGQG